MNKIYKFSICIFIMIFCVFLGTRLNTDNKVAINNNQIVKDTSIENNSKILVSYSNYKAIVTLNEQSKEINIKVVDDFSTVSSSSSDKYINFSRDDVLYLAKNSSSLFEAFKKGDLSQKYDLVSKVFNSYDTNLAESDLIRLAVAYLK